MKHELYVGQTLYKESKTDLTPNGIDEVVVRKVTNKYFYINKIVPKVGINLETLTYTSIINNMNSFKLYTSVEDLLESREKKRLIGLIGKHFSWSGNASEFSVDQLKRIVEILGID
jgi:hypothetical protein